MRSMLAGMLVVFLASAPDLVAAPTNKLDTPSSAPIAGDTTNAQITVTGKWSGLDLAVRPPQTFDRIILDFYLITDGKPAGTPTRTATSKDMGVLKVNLNPPAGGPSGTYTYITALPKGNYKIVSRLVYIDTKGKEVKDEVTYEHK
jgi:hypothetical protein